jgi:predicted ArsR family transcriptional regulator
VRARIHSISQLEVLLLLHRDPGRAWSADAVNQELRTSLQSARQDLDALHAEGLLVREGAGEPLYRFATADPDLVATVQALSKLFRDRIAALIDLVYAPGRDDLRDFADAFRIGGKKGKDDG